MRIQELINKYETIVKDYEMVFVTEILKDLRNYKLSNRRKR